MSRTRTACLAAGLFLILAGPLRANLVDNPSFEQGTLGWGALWSRDTGGAEAGAQDAVVHSGRAALKVSSHGAGDWSFAQEKKIPVTPGELFGLSGWVKCAGEDDWVQISVECVDAAGTVLEWRQGMLQSGGTRDWTRLQGRFRAPQGCAGIQFRLTGSGRGDSWWEGLDLEKLGEAPDTAGLPGLRAQAGGAWVELLPGGRGLVLGERGADPTTWTLEGMGQGTVLTAAEKRGPDTLDLDLQDAAGTPVRASLRVYGQGQVLVRMDATGPMASDFEFPGPLVARSGQYWVLPINEGLLLGYDDADFHAGDLPLQYGHGLCMPFVGLTDLGSGLLVEADTPDDASARYGAPGGGGEAGSSWSMLWRPCRGVWGYERVLRLVMVPKGGYVGLAKAYRELARQKGLLVTLKAKAARVPALAKLAGAVDLWYWKKGETWQREPAPQGFAAALARDGVRSVLWSQEEPAGVVAWLNGLGFLTGRYDCVKDVWGPDTPLDWVNHEGWPDALALDQDGNKVQGWVARQDGKDYAGGVICSAEGLKILKEHVEGDADRAYGARFLDTTTASPLLECYDPRHPTTRAQDRAFKSGLLAYLSRERGLVTGSETGADWAVPYVDYFEGMMSLGPWRLKDSGYDLFTRLKPQQDFWRFQMNWRRRIPLFELVYHDCVVSYWYWGDSSNRVPEAWDLRDRFNALYGNPPLWATDAARWAGDSKRYLRCYRDATPVARRTFFSEMLDHRFVSPDRDLQETTFSDGTRVWVNFGDKPEAMEDGTLLAAGAQKIGKAIGSPGALVIK